MNWRLKEVTARQKALLFEWGLPCHQVSRGEAARLIDKILTLKAKPRARLPSDSWGVGLKPKKGVKRFE